VVSLDALIVPENILVLLKDLLVSLKLDSSQVRGVLILFCLTSIDR